MSFIQFTIEFFNRKISPNQRSLVLRTGVGSGGENEWNFALEQYNITGDSEYLIALTQTKQVVLITRYGVVSSI